MSKDLKKLLEDCEDLVRAGGGVEVKERLAALNSAQIPRAFRLPFANLSRRLNLNSLAMRFLTPTKADDPTVAESAEYALLLQRLGALDEAEARLKELDPTAHPEVLLFTAFCQFNRWEYPAAVPILKRYLEYDLPEYKKLVGQINLSAALVAAGEHREALPILGAVLEEARRGGYQRLVGYIHEIRAQSYILNGDIEKAEEDLAKAFAILQGEGTVAEISVLKWRAVIEAKRSGDTQPLREFRKKAHEFGEWEAVRHTDLSLLRQDFQDELFNFHLFGSPWLAYRESAQRALGKIIHAETYAYGTAGGLTLDLRTGELEGKPAFNQGSKPHRALEVLARDFYRPVSPGTMFANLFPGEYFDIFSSPNRVHQVLFRVRRWLSESNLPLQIEQVQNGYALQFNGPLILTVPYEKRDPDQNQDLLRRLHATEIPPYFSAKELARALDLSPAASRRFLSWAVDRGSLEKTGAGSGTLYAFKVSQKKTA